MDAQADPSLRWAHTSVGFVMSRLKYCCYGVKQKSINLSLPENHVIRVFIFEPCYEKTHLIPCVNNKGTDQPVHPHSLIHTFGFISQTVQHLYLLNPNFQDELVSAAKQAGLSLIWSRGARWLSGSVGLRSERSGVRDLPPPCCVLEQDTLLPESTG